MQLKFVTTKYICSSQRIKGREDVCIVCRHWADIFIYWVW